MPTLTWYHGEKVLQESSRIKMIMKQDKKTYYLCCLEISNVEVRLLNIWFGKKYMPLHSSYILP
jgi:hypothetical protein